MIKKAEEINYKVFTRTNLGLKKPQPVSNVSILEEDVSDNLQLLERCRQNWEALNDFRERRRRARKYQRGDQWSDVVVDPDNKNKFITESDYIKRQGKVPLKQNIIRQLMKNIMGQFRTSETKTIAVSRKQTDRGLGDMVSQAIEYASQINMIPELDARAYEEFMLSGSCVQKLGFGYLKERDMEDIMVSNRNMNRMFFNSDVQDIRGNDFRLIGEIVDAPLDSVVASFAKTPADEARIREIYRGSDNELMINTQGLTANETDKLSWLNPVGTDKVRLFEIWYLENEWKMYVRDEATGIPFMTKRSVADLAKENQKRIEMAKKQGIPADEVPMLLYEKRTDQVWKVKYVSPSGHTLFKGETPYAHGEHPYITLLYPLIDGEVWGFIEDIIDQQRYINRTITLLDFIIGASAKGVLLVPETALGTYTPEDFSAQYTKVGGVIIYTPKPGVEPPTQISSASSSAGVSELIQMQMMLIQDISGVHGAIQGKTPASGTAAKLYAQEASNASLNTADYMYAFSGWRNRRDRKIMKLILQFYDSPRNVAISGMVGAKFSVYDPNLVRNSDYDIITTQAPNSSNYRGLIEDTLTDLLKNQLITLEMYLQHTTLPFADQLLEDVRNGKNQIGTGEIPNMDGAVQGTNPKSMALINQMLGRNAG